MKKNKSKKKKNGRGRERRRGRRRGGRRRRRTGTGRGRMSVVLATKRVCYIWFEICEYAHICFLFENHFFKGIYL